MIAPGVYDGFSLRLVEQMGFKTAAISGAGLSESNLGWADVGIMGYAENLHASAALAAFSSLPLSADGDTGYGNAINVYFTVQGFERAGLACLMIEDQVWPKRCGHMEGKQVISAEEGVEKIRAAAEARRDPDFVDQGANRCDRDPWRRRSDPAAEPLCRSRRRPAVRRCAAHRPRISRTVARNVIQAAVGQHGLRHPPAPHHASAVRAAIGGHGRQGGVVSAHAHRGGDPGHEERARCARAIDRRKERVIDRPDLLVSFDELNDADGAAAHPGAAKTVSSDRASAAGSGMSGIVSGRAVD